MGEFKVGQEVKFLFTHVAVVFRKRMEDRVY